MKGFTWNIQSVSHFKETLRGEFSQIMTLDRIEEELFNVEVKYIAEIEKHESENAIKKGLTNIQENDIHYYINNYGARGNWSIEEPIDDCIKVAVFGCSFTFGVGIPESETWSSKFVQKLQSDKPVQLINLGFPGGSISKNLKLFKYLTDVYKVDMAVFLLPSHWREEHPEHAISDSQEELVYYHNLIPNFESDIITDKWKQFYMYSTESTRFYDTLRAISYINLIASVNNIETYFSSWDYDTLDFLKENKLVEDYQVLPYFKFLENILGPELKTKFARDGKHPGIASQDLFANEISDHIRKYTSIHGISKKKIDII